MIWKVLNYAKFINYSLGYVQFLLTLVLFQVFFVHLDICIYKRIYINMHINMCGCISISIFWNQTRTILHRNPSMQEPHSYFMNRNVKGQVKIYT